MYEEKVLLGNTPNVEGQTNPKKPRLFFTYDFWGLIFYVQLKLKAR